MESWNWVAQRLAHTILLVPKALGMPRRRPIMDGLRAYMAYAAAAFAGWVRAAWLSAWVARRCWSHARSAVHTTPRTPGTGTDTAVLLRWLAGNRSRAVLLGPEVTSSSVQSLTTAAVHHTVLYVLGGRRGGVTACCCRCSTAQHGTVQHRCDRDVCFPLLCRTQCRRICTRITKVSSRAVDRATVRLAAYFALPCLRLHRRSSRLAASRLVLLLPLRPICVTRRSCSGALFFFLRRGIPEDRSVAASA